MTEWTLPKPQFGYVGRMYQATVDAGLAPGSLNRENADTIIRKLIRTNWLNDNKDLHTLWSLGGDPWSNVIKAVKSYSSEVNKARRTYDASVRAAEKIAAKKSE